MEIYLSCSEQDLETAVYLKEDLEKYTNLFVALENEDWEEVEDEGFDDQIHQAEVLLNLETETSIITAWLIDENKPYDSGRSKSPPIDISSSPTINIAEKNSYQAGFETLLGLIARNMDRNYPLDSSDEEHRHFSRQGSETNLLDDSDRAVVAGPRRAERDVTPEHHQDHGTMRDRYATKKTNSQPKLDRTEALKARRQNRANRRSLLREARAHRGD